MFNLKVQKEIFILQYTIFGVSALLAKIKCGFQSAAYIGSRKLSEKTMTGLFYDVQRDVKIIFYWENAN